MATILDLLQALNRGDLPPLPDPAPSAPIPLAPYQPGMLGPLSNDTTLAFAARNPEPVPPSFAQPAALDMNFVNQYAGAAPERPVIPKATTLQKIAAVLSGIGAGPEYAQQLRAEREAPMRRYEQQSRDYEQRRTQGLEIAERRSEREQDRAQRAAEIQYEREYRAWEKKLGVRSDEAKDALRRTFEIEKIREQERINDERDAARQKAETEKQRRAIEDELAGKDGAPASIAKEISEYRVGKRDALSPAAQRWRGARAKKLEADADKLRAQMARLGAGGGGGTAASKKRMVTLIGPNGEQFGEFSYGELKFNQGGQIQGFPKGTRIQVPGQPGGNSQGQPDILSTLGFPSLIPTPTSPTQTGRKIVTRAELKALGATEDEARKNSYTVVD